MSAVCTKLRTVSAALESKQLPKKRFAHIGEAEGRFVWF